MIFGLGLADDASGGQRARTKFAIQAAIAVADFSLGVRIEGFALPGGFLELPAAFSLLLTVAASRVRRDTWSNVRVAGSSSRPKTPRPSCARSSELRADPDRRKTMGETGRDFVLAEHLRPILARRMAEELDTIHQPRKTQ